MIFSFINNQSIRFYTHLLHYFSSEYTKGDLKKSTIVFSPHFDDETLGCGGTIIKKKRAGADVKIVFMTDGSKSHRHLISEEKLKAIRKRESLTVSHLLGLTQNDLFFLDFEETKLSEYVNSALTKVVEILLRQQPDEIFVPSRKEPPLWSLDHLTTSKIVFLALQKSRKNATIYEYPIWLWYRQPYINSLLSSPRKSLNSLKQNIISDFALLKDFHSSININDVLLLKRVALDQYKSQMTRLIPNSRWQTLSDVSNGKFLKCFFQDKEVFHRYAFNSNRFKNLPH